jgi:hypothetical protein
LWACPESTATDGEEEQMSEATYWFCLNHHRVEGEEGCRNQDRLGPYATEAEAARALERVEERNEAWDTDPDWIDEDLED